MKAKIDDYQAKEKLKGIVGTNDRPNIKKVCGKELSFHPTTKLDIIT